MAAEDFGDKVARALRNRIADLRAASHPLDLPVGEPTAGAGEDSAHVLIALADGYRLVLRCNHVLPPRTEDGLIAWNKVSRIQLLRIEHSHE